MIFHKCDRTEELKVIAAEIRRQVILSLAEAGSGHLGGSLDLADIFAVLWFHTLQHDPHNPHWEERDRLILSIGHVAPVLYASLALSGYFPVEELATLRKLGSRLQGHPGKDHGLPGLEASTGSLGQGLSLSVGLALGAKISHKECKTFCILGDGELQEGSVWEAAMSAAHHQLGNLVAVVDRNGVQIDGTTSHVMKLEPLADKWKAFGWQVVECDGHDHQALMEALCPAREPHQQPKVIIARTVMGKGVASIEGDYRWHGRAPSKEEAEKFLEELQHVSQ
ncbi:MAG: transketolase [Bacteroidetes bacterium]|nr:transketolase [Bacteroidota bacterium]